MSGINYTFINEKVETFSSEQRGKIKDVLREIKDLVTFEPKSAKEATEMLDILDHAIKYHRGIINKMQNEEV